MVWFRCLFDPPAAPFAMVLVRVRQLLEDLLETVPPSGRSELSRLHADVSARPAFLSWAVAHWSRGRGRASAVQYPHELPVVGELVETDGPSSRPKTAAPKRNGESFRIAIASSADSAR